MNKRQKEMTCGYLVESLEDLAADLVATAADAQPMQKEVMWSEVRAVIQAKDAVEWAVRRVIAWQERRSETDG